MSTSGHRAGWLTTVDMYSLDSACDLIVRAFGDHPYLVGSAMQRADHRDVDVRLILDDADFDALFEHRPRALWELLCLAVGDYLRTRTGLPIDFQIQRQTEVNERHNKPRNPLGMDRVFARGGDATPPYLSVRQEEPTP
jgi:hypothetical protein